MLAAALQEVVIEKENNQILEAGKAFTKQNEGCSLTFDHNEYPNIKINNEKK